MTTNPFTIADPHISQESQGNPFTIADPNASQDIPQELYDIQLSNALQFYEPVYYIGGGVQHGEGVFEPTPEENRTLGQWAVNWFRSARTILSPAFWGMAMGGVAAATDKLLGSPILGMTGVNLETVGRMAVEGIDNLAGIPVASMTVSNIQALGQMEGEALDVYLPPTAPATTTELAYAAAPTFSEMGRSLIEPYTSAEKYSEYWYRDPVMAAMDITILAAGARSLTRAIARPSVARAGIAAEAATGERMAVEAAARTGPELAPFREAERAAATDLTGLERSLRGLATAEREVTRTSDVYNAAARITGGSEEIATPVQRLTRSRAALAAAETEYQRLRQAASRGIESGQRPRQVTIDRLNETRAEVDRLRGVRDADARVLEGYAQDRTDALRDFQEARADVGFLSSEYSEAYRASTRARTDAFQQLTQGTRDAETAALARYRAGKRSLGEPVPGDITQYMQPPEVGSGFINGARSWIQRTPAQRWVDATVDWWMGQGTGFTVDDVSRMRKAMDGLTAETTTRFNQEFLGLTQFGYNKPAVISALRGGRLLPQTVKAVEAWREINTARMERWVARGIINPETIRARAESPRFALGLEFDQATGKWSTRQWRAKMAEYEESYRLIEAYDDPYLLPRKPPNPFEIRDDLRLLGEQPELFLYDKNGQWVSPVYYEHQYADDLVHATFNEIVETELQHSKPGFMQESEMRRLMTGNYLMDVEELLLRNIRRTNRFEGLYNVVKDVVDNYDHRRTRFPDWEPGDLVPDGYRVVYPNGWQGWYTQNFEEMVTRLAKKMQGGRGRLPAAEEAAFQRGIVEQFIDESALRITGGTAGDAALIPREIADHIKAHLGPVNPFVEVLTDPLGLRSFWTNFVLSFRGAWYVANDFTNASLTAIHGNAPAIRELKAVGGMRQMPGGAGNIMLTPHTDIRYVVDRGRMFGWSGTTQALLNENGFGRVMNNFNNWIQNQPVSRTIRTGGEYGTRFNLLRDNFYKAVNVIGEMEREFRTSARTGVGMDIGTAAFTPDEVGRIARNGGLMIDTMQEVLTGVNKAGNPVFMQEMVGRAAEAIYSWNSMASWQRRYLSSFIPFSGWRLFTNGLLYRLPVKYPGRSWLLRAAGQMGRDYVEDMWTEAGVDPDTVPDWDMYSVPLLVNDEGKVLSFRSNVSGLYDLFEVSDIAESALSHPQMKAIFEILTARKTFPEISELSEPPLMRGGEPGHQNIFDTLGEMLFGAGWNLAEKLAHPYHQYDVGGLVSPAPYINPRTGERIEFDRWSTISQFTTGVTWREHDSYDMMASNHSEQKRLMDNAYDGVQSYIAESWREQDISENYGRILSGLETYLDRAVHYVDQIAVMRGRTEDASEIRRLRIDYRTYTRQAERLQYILGLMKSNPQFVIPPEMMHGPDWESRVEIEPEVAE